MPILKLTVDLKTGKETKRELIKNDIKPNMDSFIRMMVDELVVEGGSP